MLKPLFDAFEAEIQTHGVFESFRFVKSRRAFQRRLDAQVHSIHFGYIKQTDSFDLTCDVGVRFNEVEDLLNRNREYLTDRERKQTFTIGAELGNLRQGSQMRWTIAAVEDALLIATEVADEVTRTAVPFFEQFSDVSAVAKALSDEATARKICPLNAGSTIAALRELGYG